MPAPDLNIVFSRPAYTGGALDLVFGGAGGSGPVLPLFASGSSALGGLLGSGVCVYNNRNPLRVSAGTAQRHQPASAAAFAPSMPLQAPNRLLGGTVMPMQRAQAAEGTPRQPIGINRRVAGDRAQPHGFGAPRETAPAQVHQVSARLRAQAAQAHQMALALQVLAAQLHQAATLTHTSAAQPLQRARALRALAAQIGGAARFISYGHVQPWQAARHPPPGKEVWPPVDGGNGFEPYVPDLNIVFACPPYEGGPVELLFGHVCGLPPAPTAPLFILTARFYMAVHSLTCHRLPGMEPVPIFDVSIAASAGSFDWTFNASAPASVFEQLAPSSGVPVPIVITLDGIAFNFVVDKLQKQDRFGQRGVGISGRSATALLARPYSRETARLNSAQANAQQLALAALEFTGVGLDWGIPDWLVPAGAWSHTGTPLAAVQAIVEAAGGYLQSHRTAETLLARHPYPDHAGGALGVPWEWSNPLIPADVELAPDAVMLTGTERADGPDINAVYVAGVSQGVRALYRRAGTAGDKLASLVTDPLITAAEVARMRGRSIVGAGGPKHLVSLELPVLTGPSQPGVLDVGQLVQVNHSAPWRGRVRSVNVAAKFGEKVRQTVQLEQHLET